MRYVSTFLNTANRFIQHMSMKEWAIIGIAIVVVGTFTMKGFGSRKNY